MWSISTGPQGGVRHVLAFPSLFSVRTVQGKPWLSFFVVSEARTHTTNNDDAIVAVMKEVKKVLTSFQNDLIINEWNPDLHPRGEKGHFISTENADKNEKEDSLPDSFTKRTLKLPEAEYAKVNGEINTNYYGRKYNEKAVCTITIAGKNGYYTYYFENGGYGYYNIFRKQKS